MNIDTDTVRRLRDALIERGGATADATASGSSQPREIQASLQRVAPFVETMYLMMMADGRAGGSERTAITGAIRLLTRDLVTDDELDGLLRRCEELALAEGAAARLQSIGSRICADRMDREMAFTLAAVVALADNRVRSAESSLLREVAEWYGISARRSEELLQQI
jgi:uncharacterized tellurite resistance protein B-like protein